MKTRSTHNLSASLCTAVLAGCLAVLGCSSLLLCRASTPKMRPVSPLFAPSVSTDWNSLPVYAQGRQGPNGFHPLLSGFTVISPDESKTFAMEFTSGHLLGNGKILDLSNTAPVKFGLETSLTLETTIGWAATPTPQLPSPESPVTHLVCQLWDRKTNKLVSEQDSTMLSFQIGNNLVNGLIDTRGRLHLNGQKGGVFTIHASYDLPKKVFQNLGSYESRFLIRQGK